MSTNEVTIRDLLARRDRGNSPILGLGSKPVVRALERYAPDVRDPEGFTSFCGDVRAALEERLTLYENRGDSVAKKRSTTRAIADLDRLVASFTTPPAPQPKAAEKPKPKSRMTKAALMERIAFLEAKLNEQG